MKIVKVHNDINKINFTNLSDVELNIIFYLFYLLQKKGNEEINLSFKEIKDNLNLNISNRKLYDYLKDILDNMLQFRFINLETDEKTGKELSIEQILLFQKFKVDQENKKLKVSINKEGLYLLNDLTKNFTKLNFLTYLALNKKYSKEIYRRLVQFKNTNLYRAKIEEFNELLSVPKSYTNTITKERIIEPSVKELKKVFPGLEYRLIYSNRNSDGVNKGRPKAKTIEFTGFKREVPYIEYDEINFDMVKEKEKVQAKEAIKKLSKEEVEELLKQVYGDPSPVIN